MKLAVVLGSVTLTVAAKIERCVSAYFDTVLLSMLLDIIVVLDSMILLNQGSI